MDPRKPLNVPEEETPPPENEEKKFEMEHSFEDVSSSSSRPAEKHLDLFWKITFTKNPNGSIIGLECLNHRFRWSVGAKVMIQLYNYNLRFPISMHTCAMFNARNPVHNVKTFSRNELRDFSCPEGILKVEIRVKIEEMDTGSDTDRRFDDEKAKEFSDVTFLYLASHSPVFNVLLFGNFSESEKSEISLKDIDPIDFQNFLELIHGESVVCESTLEGILNLADMYECATALRRCEHFLIEQSKLSLQEKIDIANAYGFENAKKTFEQRTA